MGHKLDVCSLTITTRPPSARCHRAGETTVAVPLAAALGLPLLSQDQIKETLFDALDFPAGDLVASRRAGAAAMQVLAETFPSVVLEANFRPHSDYERSRINSRPGRTQVCPPPGPRFPAYPDRDENPHPWPFRGPLSRWCRSEWSSHLAWHPAATSEIAAATQDPRPLKDPASAARS